MPQDALFRRASLFIVSGPSEHLHIVMNDPVHYGVIGCHAVLLVNLCSYWPDKGFDDTCILDVGDHPFIEHPTYVDYRRAVIKPADPLVQGVRRREHRMGEPFEEAVFMRVLDGFHRSPQAAVKHLRFLKMLGD